MTYRVLWTCLILILIGSCIDRLDQSIGSEGVGVLVVDGQITDQPGPYIVKLFQSSGVEEDLRSASPAIARKIILFSDAGEAEPVMPTSEPGVYQTSIDGIRGEVGRSYHLEIELLDGSVFESTPDELRPVAEIDSIYFSWEEFKPISGPTKYGFRVFMDSKSLDGSEQYMRWRYAGTYQAEAYPKARGINDNCFAAPDPPPCSGYRYTGTRLFPGDFVYTGECTCCVCWVTDPEKVPQLNDKLSTDGTYKNVEIGYAPFDQWTFHFNKYLIKVEQMSLTQEAFEFWKIIRDQREGVTDLFQPAFGRLVTNFQAKVGSRKVFGFFYASAVTYKARFITDDDAPIVVPELEIVETCPLRKECDRAFANASRTPPLGWMD